MLVFEDTPLGVTAAKAARDALRGRPRLRAARSACAEADEIVERLDADDGVRLLA